MVLSGYAHLPYAKYVLLRIDKPDAVRAWLAEHYSPRHRRPPSPRGNHPAVNVAFTHSGLRALGLPECVLERIPAAVSGRHGTGAA